MRRSNLALLAALVLIEAFRSSVLMDFATAQVPEHLKNVDADHIDWKGKDDAYWGSVLPPETFKVCRGAGTERPFSGDYCHTKAKGDYRCYCCGQLLFSSKTKFESGTGWPSFSEAAKEGALEYKEDSSYGMHRTEVNCARCGAHLGHVFDDGPPPTGKRYCINSVCLYHQPEN